MIGKLHQADFEATRGQTYTIKGDADSQLELTLDLVEASAVLNSEEQEHFSLTFSGPEAVPLGQGTFCLNHPELGALDMFLVPINLEQGRYAYESVFNRLKAEATK